MNTETKKDEQPEKIDPELDEYWNHGHHGQEGIIVSIYQLVKNDNNHIETKLFLGKVDRLIDDQEIGVSYGAGKFKLYSNKKKDGKMLTKTVYTSDIYGIGSIREQIKSKQKPPEAKTADPGMTGNPPPQRDTLETIKTIMDIGKPIIDNVLKTLKRKEIDPAEQTGKIMDKMIESSMKMMNKVQDKVFDMSLGQLERKIKGEDKQEKKWFDEYLPDVVGFIKQYGEKYLKSQGLERTGMDYLIKNNENFPPLVKDVEAMEKLYDMLSNDPEIGKEKTDAYFKELGLMMDDIPEEAASGTEEQAAPESEVVS